MNHGATTVVVADNDSPCNTDHWLMDLAQKLDGFCDVAAAPEMRQVAFGIKATAVLNPADRGRQFQATSAGPVGGGAARKILFLLV